MKISRSTSRPGKTRTVSITGGTPSTPPLRRWLPTPGNLANQQRLIADKNGSGFGFGSPAAPHKRVGIVDHDMSAPICGCRRDAAGLGGHSRRDGGKGARWADAGRLPAPVAVLGSPSEAAHQRARSAWDGPARCPGAVNSMLSAPGSLGF